MLSYTARVSINDVPKSALAAQGIVPLLNEPWWEDAIGRFDDALSPLSGGGSVLLVYGADADGFCASYFAHRVLARLTPPPRITSRAVWNFDYDFVWLAELVAETAPAVVLCFDVPIIRETAVIDEVVRLAPVAIYDHHVIPRETRLDFPRLTFLNSRDLGEPTSNHPASAFGAAFAAHARGGLTIGDLVVLAAGVVGDRAEGRHRELIAHLREHVAAFRSDALGRIASFTQSLDALFRARVRQTPEGAEEALAELLDTRDPADALDEFSRSYGLFDAQNDVQEEIDACLRELRNSNGRRLLSRVLPITTFSVGAIATRLARDHAADVIALGYPIEDRVAFELRTAGGIDLTKLLRKQKRYLHHLSSGGHENAAGALVYADQADEFERTLARALDEEPG
jgi:single-stranded DNA-specific DHH superfamily exonuclease